MSASSASRTRPPRLGLSLTQILGSTGAAVTAAFLGSRLGVAGTLIGAALASVISVVGGAIYTNSIKVTKQRVAQALVAVRSPDEPSVGARPLPLPTSRPSASPPRVERVRAGRPVLRGVLVGSVVCAAIFAGTLAIITGYESVSGTALSGGQAGSLTILGGRQIDGATTDDKTGSRPKVTRGEVAEMTVPPAGSGHAATTSKTSTGAPAGGPGTTAGNAAPTKQSAADTSTISGQGSTGATSVSSDPSTSPTTTPAATAPATATPPVVPPVTSAPDPTASSPGADATSSAGATAVTPTSGTSGGTSPQTNGGTPR